MHKDNAAIELYWGKNIKKYTQIQPKTEKHNFRHLPLIYMCANYVYLVDMGMSVLQTIYAYFECF